MRGTSGKASATRSALDRERSVANAAIYTQLVPSMHAALRLGERASPQVTVEPLYLREADAVTNFATRERPR